MTQRVGQVGSSAPDDHSTITNSTVTIVLVKSAGPKPIRIRTQGKQSEPGACRGRAVAPARRWPRGLGAPRVPPSTPRAARRESTRCIPLKTPPPRAPADPGAAGLSRGAWPGDIAWPWRFPLAPIEASPGTYAYHIYLEISPIIGIGHELTHKIFVTNKDQHSCDSS